MKGSSLVILSAILILGGCGGEGITPATDTGRAQEIVSGPIEETIQKGTT